MTIAAKIAVGILEDDPHMRRYLEGLLSLHKETEVHFSAATLKDAKTALTNNGAPDICLVDIDLPDGKGTDFVAELTAHHNAKALILTILGDRVSVMAGVKSGASGYLLKDSAPEQIIDHIKQVMNGASPMSAQASRHLLDAVQEKTENAPSPESPLTEREAEILTYFAKGLSNKETAEVLSLSSHTVRDYAKAIYSKMDVNSRSEAVFEAVKSGWIEF